MNDQQRTVQALLVAAAPTTPAGDHHVQAQVTAVNAGSVATVKWAGQTFTTHRNAAYTPAVGDQVLVVLAAGSSPVILCKLA